jgi:hypothetical protein
MTIWNLLDSGPSHSRPLVGPSKSMQGGTPGTNPCHSYKMATSSTHKALISTSLDS